MESGRSRGCLEMWSEENCKLVVQLKNISVHAVNRREIVRQSHVSFSKLLEKIQGLPPTVSSIPLELTILYNTVVLSLSLSDTSQSVNSLLYEGLVRGLEAYDGHFDEPDITKLWAMISQSIHDPTFIQAVDQLICLQCVQWLVCNQLEKIDAVFHILRDRGFVEWKKDRPQTALQYFRWALQADIQCLSALYHAAMVYRQLEMVDAELEALNHLSVALDSWDQHKAGKDVDSQVLIRPEQLVQIPATCHLLTSVNWVHVKHLLARRFLQVGRFEDAAEHYLDLLASFLEESQREVFVVADYTIPRIPEIYLEAAVALLHCRRFNDVITVSEEIASKVTCLISENLTFEIRVNEWLSNDCSKSTEAPEINTSNRNCLLNGFSEWQILGTKKKETLNYILWSATAFLYQGQAFALLKNNKESITNFTRCINLLLKVQVVCPPDSGESDDLLETLKENMTELKILQKLKSLAFTGRGIQLTERGQNLEALQNLQLSLQAYPDSFETIYHLVEVLWKLERKQEAVTFWLKETEAKQRHKVNALKQIPLFVISCLKEINTTEEEAVSKKLEEYCSSFTKRT
ncbi:Fanconi anemia group G protein isoform X3 [Hemiscyllium ocellatum]|uniref:Fanconi anemia group G protein isoform X3 n=1 Tax=Hemiscyllium ocellatum TaxID=170820 RepID=UPI0029660D81|nr:Fanconi anemia group G protein isoform X3 [Hemiscyllium ocellatum]